VDYGDILTLNKLEIKRKQLQKCGREDKRMSQDMRNVEHLETILYAISSSCRLIASDAGSLAGYNTLENIGRSNSSRSK
ncbi:MAG: hypothetical protein Q8851_01875, partial [Sweet potato little leaf phytoplasma]|nr:hypothetical protein [Sweet potato little leaf phytoplasma]